MLRLRSALEHNHIDTLRARVQVTTSMGITPLSGDVQTSLARADAALYRAKHEGRNRVVIVGADEVLPG